MVRFDKHDEQGGGVPHRMQDENCGEALTMCPRAGEAGYHPTDICNVVGGT